jgi:alkylation response protein AidB-like acyl-CoA dehydrogenase
VWLQHQLLVLTLAAEGSPANLADAWLGSLCRGEHRAGVAGGGLLPGPPTLRAEPFDDGWLLEGESPWVSGWGLIDVVHVAARTADDGVVELIVDAVDGDRLVAARRHLIAVDASRTVRLAFEGLFVPASRFICRRVYDPFAALGGPALRVNGSLALGVAARCCAMLGPSSFDGELAECRCRLDEAEAAEIGAVRAAASALALHASAALIVSAGSGAIVARHHAERLAREALFLLVFGSRPAIRTALLERLLPN